MRIVAAACRIRQGSGCGQDDLVISMAMPYRHSHIIQRMFLRFGIENVQPDDQGFVTDDGKFVDRKEAKRIAIAANQVRIDRTLHDELFSENLW